MSAPVKPPQSQSSQEQQQQTDSPVPTDPPFWYNPCGMPFDGSGGGGSGGMTMETDSAMRRDEADIIDGVLVTASSALMHAEQFAGSFVNETFKIDIKQLHERFKDSILTWVQQTKYMPKELDVSLDESYLVGLTFKGVLHAVYVGLQNLAVGLEQVVWDQNREGLPFLQDFKETTFKLKAILCEVSMAIYDINETPEQYVTRDIMPEESRTSDNQRSLRDWLILREYITGLQYVIETFEYLKSKR
ncbi:Hypothetical protein CINCED_3A022227 [Cinara cedri]|uniref:Uncharacterized protein n=1 Tax=Cinara cedri TaxID=506608 RepID=A0A5E4MLV0_9HEMI|nr:Hypothetical protein CINCED_3A022227 [Cinara cedri]